MAVGKGRRIGNGKVLTGALLLLRLAGAELAEYAGLEAFSDGWSSYGVNRSIRLVFGTDQATPEQLMASLLDASEVRRAPSASSR